jgi:hypothetical protein
MHHKLASCNAPQSMLPCATHNLQPTIPAPVGHFLASRCCTSMHLSAAMAGDSNDGSAYRTRLVRCMDVLTAAAQFCFTSRCTCAAPNSGSVLCTKQYACALGLNASAAICTCCFARHYQPFHREEPRSSTPVERTYTLNTPFPGYVHSGWA